MAANESAFSHLAGGTFTVRLPRAGVDLVCRDLPFLTLMDVLATAAEDADDLFRTGRTRFVDAFAAAARANSGAVDDENARLSRSISAALEALPPILTRVMKRVPDLVTRTLTSFIVDATDKDVHLLSVEDMLVVLDEVFKRVDAAVLAERLSSVFTTATAVKTLIQAQKERLRSNGASESPSPKQ